MGSPSESAEALGLEPSVPTHDDGGGAPHPPLKRRKTDSEAILQYVEQLEAKYASELRRETDVAHIVEEVERTTTAVWRVTSWAGQLIWWLQLPGMWTIQFLRLLLFVVALLPAFLRLTYHYWMHPSVINNIPYGSQPRQSLDVWLFQRPAPETAADTDSSGSEEDEGADERNKLCPVVIFVSGGAWIIGYKMWGFMMGKVFQNNGIIFVTLDYRNFPQSTISGMVNDVALAVEWVFKNIEKYGGDPDAITLMGQSAGAHISSLVTLRQAEAEAKGEKLSWTSSRLVQYIGISGPYDIVRLAPKIHARGLHHRVLRRVMDGDPEGNSPTLRVQNYKPKERAAIMRCLPALHLFHGTSDATVPYDQTTGFVAALKDAGAPAKVTLYNKKSHTDPILEDPIAGTDPLMLDLLELIHLKSSRNHVDSKRVLLLPRLAPEACIRFGKWINPF